MKKRNPLPYEKKIFSQNLEDGIIELLVSNIINSNKIAIEIGSGNGSENMLRNLVSNHGYTGIGHDLNKKYMASRKLYSQSRINKFRLFRNVIEFLAVNHS